MIPLPTFVTLIQLFSTTELSIAEIPAPVEIILAPIILACGITNVIGTQYLLPTKKQKEYNEISSEQKSLEPRLETIKKNIEELTADEMNADIAELERIRKAAAQKNHADQMLAAKYGGDVKFMRTHKRLRETPPPIAGDQVIHKVLSQLKRRVDFQNLSTSRLMDNEPYFLQGMFPMIKQELDAQHVKYSAAQVKYIGTCISNEYFTERNFAS